MRFKTILVTDAHKLAGLGAIRSLAGAGYSVLAAYPQGQERPAGAWSRYWTKEIRYPDPRLHQLEFQDWLRDEAARGSFDAALPVSEASVVGVASLRKERPCDFISILPDDSALEFTLSKFRSTSLALSLGITCPKTIFVSSGDQSEKWNDDCSNLYFPIIIKTDNYLTPEGTFEPGRTYFAADANQARRILRELNSIRTGIIAQELIPGYGTGAFLLRFAGKIHLSFAHRRLHEVPYTGGVSSFRESIKDDQLVNISKSILDAMNYNGVAMVEFRRSPKDGRPYFLEINGRLWGSLALALHCDVDFPAALVECYDSGAPKGHERGYRAAVKCRNIFRGEIAHVASILKASATASRKPPSKIKAIAKFLALSFNPVIRHDYFWWSDPLPGVVEAHRTIRRIIAYPIRIIKEYRRDRQLRKFRSQHQLRRAQPKYFTAPPKKLLFLCYGNTYRSPFAEHLWNTKVAHRFSEAPIAVSAGFHPQQNRKAPSLMVGLATEHGIDLSGHRSRVVTDNLVESSDAVFVMDMRNYTDLTTRFPWAKDKTYFLGTFDAIGRIEIKDPVSMTRDDARKCYLQIETAIDGLARRLLEDNQSRIEHVDAGGITLEQKRTGSDI